MGMGCNEYISKVRGVIRWVGKRVRQRVEEGVGERLWERVGEEISTIKGGAVSLERSD